MLHNDVKSMICPAILLVLIPVLHVIKGWALDRLMLLMNDAEYIKRRISINKSSNFEFIYEEKKKLRYRSYSLISKNISNNNKKYNLWNSIWKQYT